MPNDMQHKSYDAHDEQEEGLICPECLPICNDTVYRVDTQHLPLIATNQSDGYWS